MSAVANYEGARAMRLAKTDVICGLQATTARQLLRLIRGRNYFRSDMIAEVVNMDAAGAEKVLAALEAEGYLKRGDVRDDMFELHDTIKGNAVAHASFGPPISRAKAESLLSGLLERVSSYNSDPTRLLSVVEVRVFGSYLNPEVNKLGDLDIAIRYARRANATYMEDATHQGQTEGNARTLMQEILYPLTNLLKILKNRSTAINITTENIELITSSWESVYRLVDDSSGIQLTDDSVLEQIN